MSAVSGEEVAVLLLRTAWSALRDRDAPNDLVLANRLLEGLEPEEAREAVACLTMAAVAALERADIDPDEFLAALGMRAALSTVGLP